MKASFFTVAILATLTAFSMSAFAESVPTMTPSVIESEVTDAAATKGGKRHSHVKEKLRVTPTAPDTRDDGALSKKDKPRHNHQRDAK